MIVGGVRECLADFTFGFGDVVIPAGVTLELHALSQSESSNFFKCIVIKLMTKSFVAFPFFKKSNNNESLNEPEHDKLMVTTEL